jgi:predicted metal-dependent hydrolase
MPDDLLLAPGEALPLAQRLIDEGRPFHAHEVLEAAWKDGPPAERPVWKGLAQVAVGLTHARRGNGRGAVALLRRGSGAVADFPGDYPEGLDPAGIVSAAERLADRIEAAGTMALTEADLRLRLLST